jgi:hypothetical protein
MMVTGPSAFRSTLRDGLWVAELPADRSGPVAIAATAGKLSLLNVFGQQQHGRSTAASRRDRARQRRADLLGGDNPLTEHRDRGEKLTRVERLVSATGVLEGSIAVKRSRRLSDQRQYRDTTGQGLTQPGHQIQAPAARGGCDNTQSGSAAAVSVGHRGRGELVLGQHCGDLGAEKRGIVEVFDVGSVDPENVFHAHSSEVADDVVD